MTDEENIRKVLAKYCVLFDSQKWDELGLVFAQDATLSTRRGRVNGRGAIVEDLKGALPNSHGILFTSNEIITVEGDSAHVTSDFLGVDRNEVLVIRSYERQSP